MAQISLNTLVQDNLLPALLREDFNRAVLAFLIAPVETLALLEVDQEQPEGFMWICSLFRVEGMTGALEYCVKVSSSSVTTNRANI